MRIGIALASVVLMGSWTSSPAATVASSSSGPRRSAPTPSDTARAIHLLSRATFGARPGDLSKVLSMGTDRWLDRQLHPERIEDGGLAACLEPFPAAEMTPAQLLAAYPPPTAAQRAARAPGRRMPSGPAALALQLTGARLARADCSERQLEEVMTEFWFNHFNVFFGKGPVKWLVQDYEERAIRPHVFGKFEDLLLATATHPAMLIYLDNWRSVKPGVRLPARARRGGEARGDARGAARAAGAAPDGINENYGRELMELHTVGLGYTQADVIAAAKTLTGWSVARVGADAFGRGGAAAALEFRFRPRLHDGSEHVVLGDTIPPGGQEQGRELLHLLATSPATAHHVALELATRFVSDSPDAAFVDRLARVFTDTRGDLRAVTRALFTDPSFQDPATYDGRVKTPFELVASALRATGSRVEDARGAAYVLRSLDDLPYFAASPAGYPLTSDTWATSGAMTTRMNFAIALAANRLPGVTLGSEARALEASGSVADMVADVLPGSRDENLAGKVEAALAEAPGAGPAASRGSSAASRLRGVAALGLVLGSPEFQRH